MGGQVGEMGVLAHAFAAAGKEEGGAQNVKDEGGAHVAAHGDGRVDQAAVRAEREAEAQARPVPVEVRLPP